MDDGVAPAVLPSWTPTPRAAAPRARLAPAGNWCSCVPVFPRRGHATAPRPRTVAHGGGAGRSVAHQHHCARPPNHAGPSRLSRVIRVWNRLCRGRFRACRLGRRGGRGPRCSAACWPSRTPLTLAPPSGVRRRSRDRSLRRRRCASVSNLRDGEGIGRQRNWFTPRDDIPGNKIESAYSLISLRLGPAGDVLLPVRLSLPICRRGYSTEYRGLYGPVDPARNGGQRLWDRCFGMLIRHCGTP